MKTTINLHDFRRGFEVRERTNFSYNGLEALFNYFEDIEESCDTEIEYDPIAICCEYTEYQEWADFQNDYPDLNDDELNSSTQILWFEGGHIILNF